jgi:hypothetical protein
MQPARLALLLLLITATAVPAGVPLERLNPLSGAEGLKRRVTAEIENATVEAAAEKLSSVLGGRVRLHGALTASSRDFFLDRDRRASLAWKDAPIGQVVRDFCRAYHCRLSVYDEESYGLWPWHAPLGPVHRSGGYRFEVVRAVREVNSVELSLSVSSETGDAAAVGRLERLRIVDEEGRAAEQPARDATEFFSSQFQGDYPDERVLGASIRCPAAAPPRLRLVEGTVQLFRRVQRLEFEVPFPAPGEAETIAEAGAIRVRVRHVAFRTGRGPRGPGAGDDPGGFKANVWVTGPPELSVEVAGKPAFGEAVFADGSRALVDARAVYLDGYGERPPDGGHSHVRGDVFSTSGPDRRPVRLVLPLVVRSEPRDSLSFRIENVATEPGQRERLRR